MSASSIRDPELSLFAQLSERDADLVPARALDSVVSVEGQVADVLLNPNNHESLGVALAQNPENDWHPLTVSASLSLGEIATRRIKEIALIRNAHEQVTGEEDRSEQIKTLESDLFNHYNEALFEAAINKKVELVAAMNLGGIPGAEEARAMLLDELEGYVTSGESNHLSKPSPETLEAVNEWLNDQFGDVFDYMDETGLTKFDAAAIKDVLVLCISSTPALREAGWACELVDRQKNVISVSAGGRKIIVPLKRAATPEVLKKLVVHEVFGHALRSGVAESGNDDIGRVGTATYSSFEESFEVVLEQCVDGKYGPTRELNHYITIGLAISRGLSKDQIAATFRSIVQLEKMAETGKALNDQDREKVEELVRQQIGRTFAGMTDTDDGVAHMKDINYLHGTDGAWKLLETMTKLNIVDAGMRWLLSAKFNPYSEKDRALVENHHPMPVELRDLFGME